MPGTAGRQSRAKRARQNWGLGPRMCPPTCPPDRSGPQASHVHPACPRPPTLRPPASHVSSVLLARQASSWAASSPPTTSHVSRLDRQLAQLISASSLPSWQASSLASSSAAEPAQRSAAQGQCRAGWQIRWGWQRPQAECMRSRGQRESSGRASLALCQERSQRSPAARQGRRRAGMGVDGSEPQVATEVAPTMPPFPPNMHTCALTLPPGNSCLQQCSACSLHRSRLPGKLQAAAQLPGLLPACLPGCLRECLGPCPLTSFRALIIQLRLAGLQHALGGG